MKRSLAWEAASTASSNVDAGLAGLEALVGVPAGLDDAGELLLLVGGEKRNPADLVQVQANRIVHFRR